MADDCASCHLAAMATNKHNQHLISNALPPAGNNLSECYACHNTSATSGGAANLSNHMNNVTDVSFNATYAYEDKTATESGSGTSSQCSNVRCHNGVQTPTWNNTISCGDCHNEGAKAGPLPAWESSVSRSHGAHADNNTDYTDCDNCHEVRAIPVFVEST